MPLGYLQVFKLYITITVGTLSLNQGKIRLLRVQHLVHGDFSNNFSEICITAFL